MDRSEGCTNHGAWQQVSDADTSSTDLHSGRTPLALTLVYKLTKHKTSLLLNDLTFKLARFCALSKTTNRDG